MTMLLFGVVLLFGSLSPVSADTMGIAVGSAVAVGTTTDCNCARGSRHRTSAADQIYQATTNCQDKYCPHA
jgi:hypothetical protein